MRLENRVAIITGAGSGIGQGIARRFADEGARVICADIVAQKAQAAATEISACGGVARAVTVDVTDFNQVGHMVQTCLEVYSQLDILVCSAGAGHIAPFLETPPEDFERIMQLNVQSILTCGQAAAREMAKREYGRIINIASIAGKRAALGRTTYGTSKAAVIALTRQMALELGPLGITANAIGPGPVMTPLLMDALSDEGRQKYLDLIPAGRLGKVDDISDAAAYLAGEGAGYVNGQVLFVDGGYTAIGVRYA